MTTPSFASDPVPFVAGLTAVASGAIVGGKGVVINSDGTVTQISGSAASTALSVQDEDTLKVFENADSQYDQNCKSAIDPNNKNKVVYTSREDSSSSGKAVARVGTISSGSAITFGAESPTYGTGASGTRSNYIAFDPAQPGVFVVQFVDENNQRYGKGIVGTVASAGTGTTITWGSPVTHQSNYTMRDSSSAGGGLQFDQQTAGKFIKWLFVTFSVGINRIVSFDDQSNSKNSDPSCFLFNSIATFSKSFSGATDDVISTVRS